MIHHTSARAVSHTKSWEMRALTDLWTGDLKGEPSRLITTGLLGSVRWWFEAFVRGLGGSACDPSKTKCQNRKHCVVCELFGCTGWARKFRFDVLGSTGEPQREQIKKDASFQLSFTPLRPVGNEEWMLLDVTLRLVAEYGALGGKTVYKPSDENGRENAPHHRDYGLVRVDASPAAGPLEKGLLRAYVTHARWQRPNHGNFAWASLEHFWCVNGDYLTREAAQKSPFNQALGRKEDKSVKEREGRRVVRWSDLLSQQNDVSKWLAGGRGESKKILSFKDPARTFGFVDSNKLKLDDVKRRLETAWESGNLDDGAFQTGDQILKSLFDPQVEPGG